MKIKDITPYLLQAEEDMETARLAEKQARLQELVNILNDRQGHWGEFSLRDGAVVCSHTLNQRIWLHTHNRMVPAEELVLDIENDIWTNFYYLLDFMGEVGISF